MNGHVQLGQGFLGVGVWVRNYLVVHTFSLNSSWIWKAFTSAMPLDKMDLRMDFDFMYSFILFSMKEELNEDFGDIKERNVQTQQE